VLSPPCQALLSDVNFVNAATNSIALMLANHGVPFVTMMERGDLHLPTNAVESLVLLAVELFAAHVGGFDAARFKA